MCERLAAEPLFQIERQIKLIVVDILTSTFLLLCHEFTIYNENKTNKKKDIFHKLLCHRILRQHFVVIIVLDYYCYLYV